MHVEREQSRQVWLTAFGLTPWVANARLPGAQPSALLPLPLDVNATPVTPVVSPVRATSTPATPVPATPASTRTLAPVATTETAAAVLSPRLCIYQAGQTLVIVEQQDRQAPELSRNEQQLLRALLHVFGNEHKRYPFLCPKQPQQAHDTLAAFASGLGMQGCARVLLCLDDTACRHLLGEQARYQPFQLGELPALAISSLDEMLGEPLAHKKKSWASMCEAGFEH